MSHTSEVESNQSETTFLFRLEETIHSVAAFIMPVQYYLL